MKILVTGGCGFIGSVFIKNALKNQCKVMNLDALTYAANTFINEELKFNDSYSFKHANIIDRQAVNTWINEFKPDSIVHFAAESNVDKSIENASDFIQSNIVGTYILLTESLSFWETNNCNPNFRFLHVSSDEVYGSLEASGKFNEHSNYLPNNPYSASKASSDLLVRSWNKTYNFPTIITNCSNNYGPYQHDEKLIPKIILNGIKGEKIGLYGDGSHIRDWLHVDDHVDALKILIQKAPGGCKFNIGGGMEQTNLRIAELICNFLDIKFPTNSPHNKLIEFIHDRPGHDFRYAIDSSNLKTKFGWKPKIDLNSGLISTIDWYIKKYELQSIN